MTLTWSAVSTVHAPGWLLSMHAAHLRSLGCARVIYFIDRPEDFVAGDFDDACGNVILVRCDAQYWNLLGGRPQTVPRRQMRNIEFAKVLAEGDYVLHLDSDEFLLVNGDVAEILAGFPPGTTSMRVQNVERVLVEGRDNWTDGIIRKPVENADLVKLAYGSRSMFMQRGLSSYPHGKSFTRNSGDVRAGVHGEVIAGRETTRTTLPLAAVMLVHFDCISPQHWSWKLRQRVEHLKAGLKMFVHEHRMIEYVKASADIDGAVARLVEAMHMASSDVAERWKAMGVAEELPARFLMELERAAGGREVLDRHFADRSLADFYEVEVIGTAPT